MTNSKVDAGQYTVTIEDLENLGWEFSPFYDATSKVLDLTNQEAEEYNKNKYDVVVTINDNGSTEFRLDAGSEFGENEPTGDDEQTIKDIEKLIKEGKVINYIEN